MTTRTAHTHTFSRSKPTASVETCHCGKFRFTEHAGPPITEVKPMEHKTAQHTPGPWKYILETGNSIAIEPLNGNKQIATIITNDDGPTDYDWADARLIAAAPTLLEALKDATEAIGYMHEWIDEEVSGAVTPKNENIEQLVERLEQAIQKAEGRSL